VDTVTGHGVFARLQQRSKLRSEPHNFGALLYLEQLQLQTEPLASWLRTSAKQRALY
jgi:hypothetical protein